MQKSLLLFTLFLILGIAICLLFLQPFPLLHDYPEWMYQGWLAGRLFAGDGAALLQYTLVSHPVPNSLSQAAIGLLSMVFSPVKAGQVWLGVYLAGAAFIVINVWRRYRDAAQALLLTALVVFGPGFWNGYINFQCALLLFAVFLLSERHGVKSPIKTLLFSLLLFFAHAAVFAVFIIYCTARLLFDRASPVVSRLTGLLALAPSLILLSWYTMVLLSAYERGGDSSMGLIRWAQYKVYTLAKQGPFHNFIVHTGESLLERAHWLYQIGFGVNFLFAVLLAGWFVWLSGTWLLQRKAVPRDDTHPAPAALITCVVVSVLVYLAAGANTFGVVNLGERFLITALVVVLLHFRCPRMLQNLMAGVAAVFTLYVLIANIYVSRQSLAEYAVARSSATSDLTDYVDDIYASSRHQYFNHRLFIYADRGLALGNETPDILEIDLETSIIRRIQ